MGVTVKAKGSSVSIPLIASNKDSSEAYTFHCADGTKIRVGVPQLDRIVLIADLPPALLAAGGEGKNPAEMYKRAIKESIKGKEGGLRLPSKGKPFAKGYPKKDEVRTWMKVGERGVRAEIHLKPVHGSDQKKLVGYRLRVEWNPRKAGADGYRQLRACLDEHFLWGMFETWRASAEVTRLDIAVDIMGSERRDIAARLDEQTKVQAYARTGTGIETTNHYRGKVGKGRAPLVVYDKRQEKVDSGKTPQFGGTPHTRVERVLRFTNAKPKLASLANQPNRLADFRVRLLRDELGPNRDEQRLAAAANVYLGEHVAKAVLSGQYAKTAALVRSRDEEFWRPDILWKHWPTSLEQVGLV